MFYWDVNSKFFPTETGSVIPYNSVVLTVNLGTGLPSLLSQPINIVGYNDFNLVSYFNSLFLIYGNEM